MRRGLWTRLVVWINGHVESNVISTLRAAGEPDERIGWETALRTPTFNMRRSTCEIEPSSERERFEFWHSTEPIQGEF
jgi:hypothetical protein